MISADPKSPIICQPLYYKGKWLGSNQMALKFKEYHLHYLYLITTRTWNCTFFYGYPFLATKSNKVNFITAESWISETTSNTTRANVTVLDLYESRGFNITYIHGGNELKTKTLKAQLLPIRKQIYGKEEYVHHSKLHAEWCYVNTSSLGTVSGKTLGAWVTKCTSGNLVYHRG